MRLAVARRLPRRKMRGDYGKPKGFRGNVVRHVPDRPAQRDCGITRCTNSWCRLWIVSGSVRCPHCHERQASA